jgi:anti-sigma regulatory factor (Ser/Thr protein kinase)
MKIERHFRRDEVKDEFRIWTQLAKPELNLPENVVNICEYGFTEILNNVIDHANSDSVTVRGLQDETSTSFEIEDDGIGIFSKLCNHFGFDNEIHALIELVKGKLTVAPQAHSGEGLFFSSKMFDQFSIESGGLSVTFEDDECSVKSVQPRKGTLIRMKIANNSQITSKGVFDKFCDAEEFTFYKTRFFVSLAALEGGLISRSQAKRVAARLDSFGEVELNFHGVDQIGQAFADELLRVWPLNHPQTRLKVTNADSNVSQMINHIKNRKDLPQPASNGSEDNKSDEDDVAGGLLPRPSGTKFGK